MQGPQARRLGHGHPRPHEIPRVFRRTVEQRLRELEIIGLVAEGLSNVEIAERLSLRVKTVESQLRRLFDRYDVTSRTALARLALRQGWIDET
jgi:DNA-binding NarL/FixJ family response regulator